MTVEKWLPVVGYEDRYLVSDQGNLWAIETTHSWNNQYGKVCRRPRKAGPLKASNNRDGYHVVTLGKEGARRQWRVHRLVLIAFVGQCPNGMEARHLNGNPTDNRLENLVWGTPSANGYDKVRHGTHAKTARKTCPRLHPLAGANLEPAALRTGHRACRSCSLARLKIAGPVKVGAHIDQDLLKLIADKYYEQLMSGWQPSRKPDDHPWAKLNTEKVLEIRRLAAEGRSQKALSAQFGVGENQVGRIIRRVRWANV